MSDYYSSRRTRNLFNPKSSEPFRLSRSKIDLFLECPRCFYIDRRLGVARPAGFPFNLNSAVDHLLKKEFDVHRAEGTPHPLMDTYGIDAVPFKHKDIDTWRENFVGVQYLHKNTNFLITGAVDDVWVNKKEELIVVDYKATSKDSEINLDAEWQDGYKRQMEVYQWLLRQNGFKVSDTGYFVYANGKRDRKAFDGRLEFDVTIIPYTGSSNWINSTLLKIHASLNNNAIPESKKTCDYCSYINSVADVTKVSEKIVIKKIPVKTSEKLTLFDAKDVV
ncbi:PD-(D/E)XK nuclease family protein [Candidatus Parcubacteria bacterium]|nr:PD-(D/E)XK nuclease family protein [Candidatus Parcubacteria bacterium]